MKSSKNLWLVRITYGFNRADWSYIPGGVISGASLVKPDYMELKARPNT